MAIKISGNTVIDDSRNITNAVDITASGTFTANSFIGDGSQLTNISLAAIEQPVNVSPADDAANVAQPVTLTSSTFRDLYGKSHSNSQFQVSTSSDFSSPEIDSGFIGANTSWEVPISNTAISTEYFWRVRYKNEDGDISDYSTATSFTTANTFINIPTLTVEGANTDSVPESPTLSTSAFSVFNGSDTHLNTDWQVEATANSTVVWESLADSSNKTSITVPSATLVADTEYIFRARHRGTDYGTSEYDEVTANTVASFGPTTIGESFGGGYYTGTICAAGTCYYLIVAPNASGCACCIAKCFNTVTGMCNEADQCVNGYNNTYAYMANSDFPAGNFTATRTIGGFSDWYLPAINELNQLYNNKGSMPAGEGYSIKQYWSSTEDFTSLCIQSFNNGSNSTSTGGVCRPTRAIRRIPF